MNSRQDWKRIRWGDLATLEYGKGLRDYGTEGFFPVYGTNGQIGWCDQPLCNGPGVIIGRKGAYRGVQYSKAPFFVIDTAFYLKPIVQYLDIKWAYYQLLNFNINSLDSGSAIPSTSREAFYQIPVNLPPLHTQCRIASVLSAYDYLIENNNRRIRILEEMAENIYREWFVNFRFPGHEKVKIVDSEFGPKPEGWEVTRLGNLLRKLARKPRLKKEEYLEDGTVPAIDQGSAFVGGYTNAAEFTHNDPLPIIVFGDHTRVVKYIDFPFASGADGTQLLYPQDEDLMPAYFYYLVKNIDLSDYAYARHFKFLKDQVVLVPNRSVLREFNETVESMLKLMSLLRSKNDILRRIRDLLLPKLISGEIAVENLDIVAGGLE